MTYPFVGPFIRQSVRPFIGNELGGTPAVPLTSVNAVTSFCTTSITGFTSIVALVAALTLAPTAEAQASISHVATVAASAPLPTASASANITHEADVAVSATLPTASGTISLGAANNGTVAATAYLPEASASANITNVGTAGVTAPLAEAAVTGNIQHHLAAAVVQPLPTASVAANITHIMTGAMTTPLPTAAIVGVSAEGFQGGTTDNNSDGIISLPSGAAVGDVAVFAEYVVVLTTNFTEYQLPSGCLPMDDGTAKMANHRVSGSNTIQYQFFYKILDAADISAGTVTSAYQAVKVNIKWVCQLFRAPWDIVVAVPADVSAEYAADATTQNLNSNGAHTPSINIAGGDPDDEIVISPTPDNVTQDIQARLSTSYFASTGANWTVDDDTSGGNEFVTSGRLELYQSHVISGAMSITLPTASGTISLPNIGSVAAAALLPTTSVTGNITHVMTAAPSTLLPTAAVTGETSIAGTVAASTLLPTAAATANITHKIAAAPATLLPTTSVTGNITHKIAAGSVVLSTPVEASVSANITHEIAAAASTLLPTASVTGNITHKLTAAASAPLATASGTISLGSSGITMTFVAQRVAVSGYALNLPTGSAAGDLLIVAQNMDGTSNLTPVGTRQNPPTIDGSMSVFDDGVNSDTFFYNGTQDIARGLFYKVLTSADITAGTISCGVTGGADTCNSMVAQTWRPDSAISTVTMEYTYGLNGFGTDPSSQSITGSGGAVPMMNIALICNDGNGCTGITFDQTTTVNADVGMITLGVQFEDTTAFNWTLDNAGTYSTNVGLYGAAIEIA